MKKLYFLVFLSSVISFGQTQIGTDIDGEVIIDLFGNSVSLSSDGSVLAIGAHWNDGNGTNSGNVRIYKNILGVWTQLGSVINGEAANDWSGFGVSLSSDGNIVAIGASQNNANSSDSGHVRVYQNISGVWTQIGSDIDGEAANDWFGLSVSLSSDGNVIAIGARGNDGNGSNSGHVRVFQNISGIWTQIGSDINGEAINDLSGQQVSLSSDGNVVAIGAPNNDGNGSDSGHVRIYQNISGVWTQVGSDINGEAAGDNSSLSSVSLSSNGNVIAIGAKGNDGNGSDSGHVRVYQNISGVWTQVGLDINGEAANDESGLGLSLSSDGNVVAIGALNNDENGSDSGHVRIYQNISGTWIKIGVDINGEAAYDSSGYGLSLSSNGNVVAIGAPNNDGNIFNSTYGHVRVYDLSALLSSDSFVLDNFSIYPNPTSDFIKINLESNLTLEKVNIYSTLGQLIKTEDKSQINISSLAKGNYYIEVITNQGKAIKTIIIE